MLYTDPIYGSVEIQDPVILDLIQSPALQRLKHIDQAGYFFPFFPEGNHSRFEHSMGVYLLLKRYGASLEEQIAGLIHDVSHGTFSHCLDYVFAEGSQKEQTHQDNIFEAFVKTTDIPDILQKYGLAIDYIIDDTHFPLKETNLPDLCADRIDYSLRTAHHYDKQTTEQISYFLEHLVAQDEKRMFDNLASAKKYAEMFYAMNDKYMSDMPTAIMFQTVGDCLKYAWKQGYLTREDFYTTDKEVLDKITAHIENDAQLSTYWQRMNNQIPCKNDPADFDFHLFCKTRIVDPLFLEGEILKRVSDEDNERKIFLATHSHPKEYFLKFEK